MDPAAHRWELWGRFLLATVAGHLGGALFWALPFAYLTWGGRSVEGPALTIAMLALTILAALGQGAVLGLVQGPVVRRALSVPVLAWTRATVIGVVLGWSMLVVAGTEVGAGPERMAAMMGGVAVAGGLFGLFVGLFQAMVLRTGAARGAPWVMTSIAAWSLAMLATVGVLSFVPAGAGWSEVVLLGAIAAVLAGVALGAIGGGGLVLSARPGRRHRRLGGPSEAPA